MSNLPLTKIKREDPTILTSLTQKCELTVWTEGPTWYVAGVTQESRVRKSVHNDLSQLGGEDGRVWTLHYSIQFTNVVLCPKGQVYVVQCALAGQRVQLFALLLSHC